MSDGGRRVALSDQDLGKEYVDVSRPRETSLSDVYSDPPNPFVYGNIFGGAEGAESEVSQSRYGNRMDVLPSPGSTSGDEEYYYQTCESDITGISSRYSLLVDEGIQQRSPSLEIVRVDPAPRIPSEERLSISSARRDEMR